MISAADSQVGLGAYADDQVVESGPRTPLSGTGLSLAALTAMTLPGPSAAPRSSSKTGPRFLRDFGREAGLSQTLGGMVIQNLVWGVRVAKELRAWALEPDRPRFRQTLPSVSHVILAGCSPF